MEIVLITLFINVSFLSVTGHRCPSGSAPDFVSGEASSGGQVRLVKRGACKLGGRTTWQGAGDSNVETASASEENTTR